MKPAAPPGTTACLAFDTGELFFGRSFGADGLVSGELCFNTAMTGYQEIMTDPSYAGQIIAFTFPHIGNVGVTAEDDEAQAPVALGMIARAEPTQPSNWRAAEPLPDWLKRHGRLGLWGVDTRRLTRLIRARGAPSVALWAGAEGALDADALVSAARGFAGLEGADLTLDVTRAEPSPWDQTIWTWPEGFGRQTAGRKCVVAVDYGAKRNILRLLATAGCDVLVVPAETSAADILAQRPDGVFLSNGPGDPAATASHAVPTIQALLEARVPIFGICLGHQLLGLALGARTVKMPFGHHGANHPVKEIATGKVEITSMNHGFAVDADSLPVGVTETHVSLFDRSNCGLAVEGAPVFSVQHHPEASPGPQDSHYLFDRFVAAMDGARAEAR